VALGNEPTGEIPGSPRENKAEGIRENGVDSRMPGNEVREENRRELPNREVFGLTQTMPFDAPPRSFDATELGECP
jgi:hypothetical protein